ncbi:hypothetical protein FHR81_001129 [Actinoalloteichus hoggarensis]|uniref:Uncharacterized protein n=1 Tax=Actinoalloteichus hoggarensis TaxID=1470176 RepID=A0A221VZD0_9PSEU|nr:hypothetical protein [Actinoalloteichus hoggarensis]ASO18864.1 hypothetical protein AHOG_06060 [Actinoalloteichus hoggarensis]MBB5920099.1 hypothetical protein [Actinoalloteichus hoggarensis]
MSAADPTWFTVDAPPAAGLWLDRHLVRGTRPADGTRVTAACGRELRVGPTPECDVDGLRLTGLRPCWACAERAMGRAPGAATRHRATRHRATG